MTVRVYVGMNVVTVILMRPTVLKHVVMCRNRSICMIVGVRIIMNLVAM